MSGELLTVSQAADYLKVSEKTVRRLISSQKLLAAKVGDRSWRIKESDIEAYLQAHSNGKKGAESK
ncbi:MAG: Helix-turn-helix domain protein [Pelotomaculum sp. PtaU1.Bin035]|nr:MAG: Helix-turn-helix domain protein [Pelotomaculum sp. PtaU1.Bin035]